MSDNPRPDDDEEWTVDEELEESDNYEENQELDTEEEDEVLGYLSRRQALGMGVTALGLGSIAAAAYWEGGNADNTSNYIANDSENRSQSGENGSISTPDTDTPDIATEEPVDTPTPEDDSSDDEVSEEGNMYELEDGVTVDLDSLDSIFEYSDVDMGIQENGNLVAWNQNVEIEGEGGSTFSPLYRFRSDLFPDREFYEVDGNHPIEEIYSELEGELTEEMSEGMVKVFYDENQDEGSWEDHREFKRIGYDDLKEGLLEHSGLGATQDYFFNRVETMRTREAELEGEWEDLLKDGLEAN